MAKPKRAAFAASDKQRLGGKTRSEPRETQAPEAPQVDTVYVEKSFKHYVPLVKANSSKQTVFGVVLQPEVVDAQGDIMSEEVIEDAADNFMSEFNKKTKLGFMHKVFTKNFKLLQSFIAPQDLIVNNQVIKKGSWVMKIKVVDAKIWKMVQEGKIKGFSIGGKAKVQELSEAA